MWWSSQFSTGIYGWAAIHGILSVNLLEVHYIWQLKEICGFQYTSMLQPKCFRMQRRKMKEKTIWIEEHTWKMSVTAKSRRKSYNSGIKKELLQKMLKLEIRDERYLRKRSIRKEVRETNWLKNMGFSRLKSHSNMLQEVLNEKLVYAHKFWFQNHSLFTESYKTTCLKCLWSATSRWKAYYSTQCYLIQFLKSSYYILNGYNYATEQCI